MNEGIRDSSRVHELAAKPLCHNVHRIQGVRLTSRWSTNPPAAVLSNTLLLSEQIKQNLQAAVNELLPLISKICTCSDHLHFDSNRHATLKMRRQFAPAKRLVAAHSQWANLNNSAENEFPEDEEDHRQEPLHLSCVLQQRTDDTRHTSQGVCATMSSNPNGN